MAYSLSKEEKEHTSSLHLQTASSHYIIYIICVAFESYYIMMAMVVV